MARFEEIYDDDVVSETFLVCWRKLDRVPEEPLPWLRDRQIGRHGHLGNRAPEPVRVDHA
jgi:hypothetical protein